MSDSNSTRRSLLKKVSIGLMSLPAFSGVGSATSYDPFDDIFDDDDKENKNSYTAVGDKTDEDSLVEYSVELVSGRDSISGQPITVEVSITNKHNSTLYIADQEESFFHGQLSRDQDFIIIPSEASENYYSNANGCWILTQGYFPQESFDTISIDSGETISRELYILNTGDDILNTCLEYPDRIRFPKTQCYVFSMIGSQEDTVNWGFKLVESSSEEPDTDSESVKY